MSVVGYYSSPCASNGLSMQIPHRRDEGAYSRGANETAADYPGVNRELEGASDQTRAGRAVSENSVADA